jgi:lipopolysaccharide/colanic/teichoic acid biosynthesis glycosyltransferase
MLQEKIFPVFSRPGATGLVAPPVPQTATIDTLAASPLSYRIAKRTLDIALSLTVLLVLSPVLLVVALLIRLTSEGPAIYRQRRVGEGGRIFTMYKFRSMYRDCDSKLHLESYKLFLRNNIGSGKVDKATLAELAPEVARAAVPDRYTHRPFKRLLWRIGQSIGLEDPRVTPIGALIRKTSIDELPQLFNVLIGDMSLVGPRPPIPYEVRLYEKSHLQRLAITPGVTGIWQVYGRNKVSFQKMVEMDMEYIACRSFWLDLRLILLTVPAVLFSRSAR